MCVVFVIFLDTPSPQLGKELPKTLCHVKPNYLFGDGVNPSAIQIAIDWDPTALHLRYQSTRERVSVLFLTHNCKCILIQFNSKY